MDIFGDISQLNGIGKQRKQKYNKLGIFTINDLLWHIPRNYIDFASYIPISSLKPGETAAVEVCVLKKRAQMIRKNLIIYTLSVTDGMYEINIKMFNALYYYNQIQVGNKYIFFGKVVKFGKTVELNFIDFISAEQEIMMFPIYNLTFGISSKMIAQNVKEILATLPDIPEYLPTEFLEKYNLATFEYAIKNIHFPKNREALKIASKRLTMDELVLFSLEIAKQKMENTIKNVHKIKKVNIDEFLNVEKFKPTNAQMRVIKELLDGMRKTYSMNRLIQGDVGCGKTFVAAASVFAVCKSGFQAAVMAPTEILVLQHYEYFSKIFSKLGIKIELICNKLKAKEKRDIIDKLRLKAIDCLIGTSALLSDYVEFSNLGLVITDEQHKFGVYQREKLQQKGNRPHTIIMSATPIPRTLAMMMYDNLEISIIDEMPQNRIPVKTYLVDSKYHSRVFTFIKKELDKGRQCFIVCPAIENDECPEDENKPNKNLKVVVEYAERLKKHEFKNYSVDFIHGKQNQKQRDEVMYNFKQNKIQLLVATTVIEVGIDIPNATVMVIENADYFGLAQLHQLRGRIGRGEYQSYCILISNLTSPKVKERLKFITNHYNGFEIAEYDLKTRGPGEFLGARQHGVFNFKMARYIDDVNKFVIAQNIANEIFKADPQLCKEKNRYINKYLEDKLNNFYKNQ